MKDCSSKYIAVCFRTAPPSCTAWTSGLPHSAPYTAPAYSAFRVVHGLRFNSLSVYVHACNRRAYCRSGMKQQNAGCVTQQRCSAVCRNLLTDNHDQYRQQIPYAAAPQESQSPQHRYGPHLRFAAVDSNIAGSRSSGTNRHLATLLFTQ